MNIFYSTQSQKNLVIDDVLRAHARPIVCTNVYVRVCAPTVQC